MRQILKILCIWVGVIAIFVSASAQPASDAALASIKLCRTLKEDTQRLKCFDKLVSEQSSDQSAPKGAEIEAVWTIKENKSPQDDTRQVTALLLSISGGSALILRCKEKKTEAIFSPSSFSYTGNDPVTVWARINNGRLVEARWNPFAGHGAFAPSAVQLIQALPDNGKLFLKILEHGDKSTAGEFNLGKVSDIRDKIAVACNWPDWPKRQRRRMGGS